MTRLELSIPLTCILILLDFEYVSVEVPLQLLIGVVDQQLLKTVGVKLLEPINVQHTNEAPLALARLLYR